MFPSFYSEGWDAMRDHAVTKWRVLLVGLANGVCDIFRRVEERRRLSKLSPFEWRDLGIHEVRKEFVKWPWEY